MTTLLPIPPSNTSTTIPSPVALVHANTLRQLNQDNALRFGDEIRLFCRSNFLKKPKPVWLDPEHKGWTKDELKGGYLGAYTKSDKTTRILVPPVGELASGNFSDSYFRVEDVFSGKESYGRPVAYGDVVVLVDGDGNVWNNKTGGLFLDGYLTPRERGSPGEVFVSFQKNGKRGDPVLYGDVGVFLDVEDSHRFRVGFNNRMTNYKGGFSSVAGGYLNSDGSGEPLTFVAERYRGKIKARKGMSGVTERMLGQQRFGNDDDTASVAGGGAQGTPTNAAGQKSPFFRLKSMQLEKGTTRPIPAVTSVSIITLGKADVMRLSPPYGTAVNLYGLKTESQVEIDLSDETTLIVEASEILAKKQGGQKTQQTSQSGDGKINTLQLHWKSVMGQSELPAVRAWKKKHQPDAGRVFLAIVKLLVIYFVLLNLALLTMSEYDFEHFTIISNPSLTSRGAKRLRMFVVFLCYLLDLVTPSVLYFYTVVPGGEGAKEIDEDGSKFKKVKKQPLAIWSLTFTYMSCENVVPAESELPLSPRSKVPYAPSTDVTLIPDDLPVQAWQAAGTNPATGEPLHFAWVRFLNGERGNKDTGMKRWNTTSEWRQENNIDGMLDRPHRLFFLIKAHYPHFFYGRSKYGNPIYIEHVGRVNMKALRAGGCKLKDMIFHYIYTAEFMWNVLEPSEYGSSLTILDISGVGFFDFAGEVTDFVKKATAVVQEHYPERGFMVFIINAPGWFTGIWKIISAWINPHTREKIKILGKDFESELLKVIPKENLPIMYGGTNARLLGDSDEERLLRNIAARALIKNDTTAVAPDGGVISVEELKKMIDPSVDHLLGKVQMQKTSPDGTLLCDTAGRPVVKTF